MINIGEIYSHCLRPSEKASTGNTGRQATNKPVNHIKGFFVSLFCACVHQGNIITS